MPSTSPFFAVPDAISASVAGLHLDAARGHGHAVGGGLAGDVDHVGLALGRRNG
jgi:hypothetical protein